MPRRRPPIPSLFRTRFTVETKAPFRRHLNRLEVEIGREDYGHLKTVELLAAPPSEADFSALEEITGRLLATTQNLYNRDLLQRLGLRVYLDRPDYAVYYRLPGRVLRFTAAWRQTVLNAIFGFLPREDTGWHRCACCLPGFCARFLPDAAGGVLLLRRGGHVRHDLPLVTATHCPYDPHTLEVTLWLLRIGAGRGALINLGFSGREPLTDENLKKLQGWGIPLNPSSIDVIYPYTDSEGHPFCFKLEKHFPRYVSLLGGPPPALVIDIHGCVGTRPGDRRILVGLGGHPPFPELSALGEVRAEGSALHLHPSPALRHGLAILERLRGELWIQFCTAADRGSLFRVEEDGSFTGRDLDPRREVASLLPGETRNWLPAEGIRWLPGAGGNARQRREARRLRPDALCLHVEIPLRVRLEIASRWRSGCGPSLAGNRPESPFS